MTFAHNCIFLIFFCLGRYIIKSTEFFFFFFNIIPDFWTGCREVQTTGKELCGGGRRHHLLQIQHTQSAEEEMISFLSLSQIGWTVPCGVGEGGRLCCRCEELPMKFIHLLALEHSVHPHTGTLSVSGCV